MFSTRTSTSLCIMNCNLFALIAIVNKFDGTFKVLPNRITGHTWFSVKTQTINKTVAKAMLTN